MRTARPMWSTISSAISCIIALLHHCIIALLHYCIIALLHDCSYCSYCIIVYEREAQMNQVSQWAMLRTI